MATNKDINPVDLGLEKETKITKEPVKKVESKPKEKSYEDKKLEAAAAQAVKTAAQANAEMTLRDSEREYALAKRRHMLDKCREDRLVTITPSKMLADIFGSTYTFSYNGIPVTVKFNGLPQKFPKFIADKIQEKIYKTSEANTYKEVIENM